METTKKIANLMYDIDHWIDPYGSSSFDKEEIIESTMKVSLEENLGCLTKYINEGYETIPDLLEDKELIKLLAKLYKEVDKEREVQNRKNDLEILKKAIKDEPNVKQWYVLRINKPDGDYNNEIEFKTYAEATEEFIAATPKDQNERIELMFAPVVGDNIVALHKN